MKSKNIKDFMDTDYSIENEDKEKLEIFAYKQMGRTILMFCPYVTQIKNKELFEVFLGYWIVNEYSSKEKYEKRIFKPINKY